MKIEKLISVANIAIDAGLTILDVYRSADFGIEVKKDNSPLTIADSKSHEVIVKGLSRLSLEGETLPLLSEEGRDIPYEERKEWDRYWLIDPLDGTKEFIKRNGEFTVNIALVEKNIPAAGFVYVPVKDVLYFGAEGLGSFKLSNASMEIEKDVMANAVKLNGAPANSKEIRVVASRSHLSPETENYIKKLESKYTNVRTVSSGSSIKLCMAAEGSAHVYPRFAPTMEWDTAAAHAVCKFAGVNVVDYKQKTELVYNKENLLNPWFLVYVPGFEFENN